MALNADIQAYENASLTEDEVTAVNGLLALGVVINWLYPMVLQRLKGGEGELSLRQQDKMVIDTQLVREGMDLASEGASWLYNKTRDYVNSRRRRRPLHGRPERPQASIPKRLKGGEGAGAAMLAWKNSLTKMYHTFQVYNMSPVLSAILLNATIPVHTCQIGNGPHLYWTYSTATSQTTYKRNISFNQLYYWDGGWVGNPTAEVASPFVPAKNYRLGTSGTIYVMNANWPGTIMNHDPLTHDTTNQNLNWIDSTYSGTVTTTNYPRTWTSVFANTNWQYLTIYGIQYRFDCTNYSPKDYCLEISLFRFKADIDAMDYEKQVLAHFGGYHAGTNAYVERIAFMPSADVSIIKTKRYMIPGMKIQTGTAMEYVEGNRSNNRTIKYNIKNSYVLKRPLLNSYETNLTEKQIYDKYYEAQKGVYFRFMAWPLDLGLVTSLSTGLTTIPAGESSSPNLPKSTYVGDTPAIIGSGVSINMTKKAYFKMDENAATF